MKRALALSLLAVVLVSSAPTGLAQEDTDEPEERCMEAPDVKKTYEWAFDLSNNRTRLVEVVDRGPATTPRGHHNITRLGFEEYDVNNELKAWGHTVRYAPTSIYAWGLSTQDRWERVEDETTRRLDSFDPPFRVIHRTGETCPGERWQFTTRHAIQYGKYGQKGNENASETWEVQAQEWTNITVPAGTFEVLPVKAIRTEANDRPIPGDRYQITTYWAPEAMAPAKVEQGPGGVPESSRELTEYILDRRPVARFEVTPLHPSVGDNITLNATASFDYDGEVEDYRWQVGETMYNGSVVSFNATETGTLDIQLFIRDANNRTGTISTTRYVAPQQGSGIGIDGPETAVEGEIVTIKAFPSFDPTKIRWRIDDQVVGNGETYQFYMNQTTRLDVDVVHESGRVYNANHTVELVRSSQGAGGSGNETTRYPPGATAELAILEPLEGQVVPQTFPVRLQSRTNATLFVDERPVWQGSASSAEETELEVEPGSHTLRLTSEDAEHTVNITASSTASDGSEGDGSSGSASDASDSPAATPGPSVALATLAALGAALMIGRRR